MQKCAQKYIKQTFFCRQGNCRQKFVSINTLLSHIKTHHILQTTFPSFDSKNIDEKNNNNTVSIESEKKVLVDTKNEVLDFSILTEKSIHDISASAAKMIATLRTSSTFTGKNINKIINVTESLLSDISNFVKNEIFEFLKSKNISILEEDEKFFNKFKFNNLFEQMQSLEGQIKTIKSIYQYIDLIEIPLEYRFDKRFDSKTQR